MAIWLSLLSACAYGVSDFLGGIFTKQSSPWRIAAVGQTSSLLCVCAVAALLGDAPARADLAWGAAAGLGSGLGAAFLYRGLAAARMSVVAPLSAVCCALVPVAVGVAAGERPSAPAAAGIALAFPAIALISLVRDPDPSHRGGVVDGLLAGVGFGFMFAALGQVSDDAGLTPLAGLYLCSVIAVAGVASLLGQSWLPRAKADWRGALLGPIGVSAVLAFYVATKHGLLSIVSVVSSLYPAATVLLAAVVLRERVTRWQAIGLALATAAVSLVASD